jgi:rfaE bifunctional protein kinase chain/domain
MTRSRLHDILSGFPHAAVVVVGDFFLDKYLEIDPALAEVSVETGLEARQVTTVRCQPGAAGTIVSNLCALGVGRVLCVGFVGDDGEGFELVRGLRQMGAETGGLLVRRDRFTPTYCKPLVRVVRGSDGRLRELERLDTKNRTATPPDLDDALAAELEGASAEASGIIAQDQVQEADCGVITSRLRQGLSDLAEGSPDKVWFGDSRTRIGEYRSLIVKPNREECCATVHPGSPTHDPRSVLRCAAELSGRVGRPVYLTLGKAGMALVTPEAAQPVPTVRLEGELDIVGAGDSATAGIVAALCAGASGTEAAVIGNLVASITVQQIGTTGTATQEQVREQFVRYEEIWRER